jgi:hypothetical protein
MPNLGTARALANRIRVAEDLQGAAFTEMAFAGREEHKDSMLRHGLLVSSSVTPLLERRIAEVCERLRVPRDAVTAFVYNEADVQADCLVDTPDSCVLRFSSGLVNLMDEKEFQFVVAHELGHFLLGHGACSQHSKGDSTEGFLIQRSRELSADRIGFLGVDNLDESVQAIIKTASGLGNEFLRFDVASFLSQAELLSNPRRGESYRSTHPSMVIRCRALLWFSMSVPTLADLRSTPDNVIRDVDKKVLTDLERYVDGQVRARKLQASEDITLWKSCVLIVESGAFTNEMQHRVVGTLGEKLLAGLKAFLESHSSEELVDEASKRLESSIESLYREFPGSAAEVERVAIAKAYETVEP